MHLHKKFIIKKNHFADCSFMIFLLDNRTKILIKQMTSCNILKRKSSLWDKSENKTGFILANTE